MQKKGAQDKESTPAIKTNSSSSTRNKSHSISFFEKNGDGNKWLKRIYAFPVTRQ
jgi:hypothetical protein